MTLVKTLAAGLLAGFSVILSAQNYVLSPTGDDRASGVPGRPWATLARAAKSLRPGDQLMSEDGTYAGPLVIQPPAVDFPGRRPPIRVFAHHAGMAVVTAPPGGPAIRIRQAWNVELAGLVLDGAGRGAWFDIRETTGLLLHHLHLTAPGPKPAVWERVNSAAVLDCVFAGGDGAGLAWQCRNTGLVLWERCRFEAGTRVLLEFSGECRLNTFRSCGFFGSETPVLRAPAAVTQLSFVQCVWRDGARPPEMLWEEPNVLFRRCYFDAGGFPAYARIRACAVHNTAMQAAPAGTPGPRCSNNFFCSDAKSAFRPGKTELPRLRRESPARDAGSVRLTAVTQNVAAAQTLPVADAGFFLGRGATRREPGDMIWIGETRRPARVLGVDPVRNTLELDRTVDAEAGAAVVFPYHGAAPDLGAYEIGMDVFGRNIPGVPRKAGANSFRTEWRFAPGVFTEPSPGG